MPVGWKRGCSTSGAIEGYRGLRECHSVSCGLAIHVTDIELGKHAAPISYLFLSLSVRAGFTCIALLTCTVFKLIGF